MTATRMRLLLTVLLFLAAAPDARSADRLWYAPNPGTLDMLRMFEQPEEWPHTRQLISVYQFSQQHTLMPADPIVGPNSYDALARVDAFRKLVRWGKKIAIGVGSVKPFYCTDDATGMQASIAATVRSIAAVETAGGTVSYLAMDEPFLSGQFSVCGGSLIKTAERLQVYMETVRSQHPDIRIGLIEAYPSFSPAEFASMLELMAQRGILPAFVQVDVDLRAVRPGRMDLSADLRALRQTCIEHRTQFGLIVWGYNGDADALFARDAHTLAENFWQAFPTRDLLPQQISIQSWSESSTGLRITPSNLPETDPDTLTGLCRLLWRRFIGQVSGNSTGTAIPR